MAALKGRLALVTGASAGIGRATALALAAAGADVFLTGRNAAALDTAAASCRAQGVGARAMAGDLNDTGFVAALAEAAGEADILVNNAGILTYAPLLETAFADVEAMFRTNVLAAFAIAQEMARRMVARRRGHIVFVTSGAARNVNQFGVAYAATKHALAGFAKGFRLELKGTGVKVSEVAPGMVDTGIRDASRHPAVLKALAARTYGPLTSEEVAEAILFALTAPERARVDLLELQPRET
ncbi:SDR family oxidoreductase [Roseomonas sp. AR75]|uniref:SDR family oxidoreductase n=1 Tax=Roseomonas sp. AR75 TaxID=2562311 RepID=UPI0010BFEDDC|nr:SDR family oxidoreductase [Roseomonas sp. AR75]